MGIKDFPGIIECTNKIFEIYFDCFIKEETKLNTLKEEFNSLKEYINPRKTYNDFVKKILKDKLIAEESLNSILELIKQIYEANLNSNNYKQLLYDDTFFFEENWISNITMKNNYHPLVIYFLLKYQECERDLRNYLKQTKKSQNEFPLFL